MARRGRQPELTGRDMLVLEALGKCQVMTSEQIRKAFYGDHTRYHYIRLQVLCERGFIVRRGKMDLSLAGWYWSHPFDAAVSWMASGELSHPEVRQTWLLLNLLLGGIALVVYLGSKTRGLSSPLASKSLRLSQDPSHGTAGWMTASELRKILKTGSGSPGLPLTKASPRLYPPLAKFAAASIAPAGRSWW